MATASRQEPALLELDHLGLITDRRQRRQALITMRRLGRKRRLAHLTVLHEHDDACCQREAWAATLARLITALNADGESVSYLGPDGYLLALPGVG